MKCDKCPNSVFNSNVPLHRMNEKGIKGIFRCEECMTPEEKKTIDPVIKDILDAIEPKTPS